VEFEGYILGPHDPRSSTRRRRAQLAALATRQHGVVARRQLLSLGFTRDEVKGSLGACRLLAIHPGVYAVGHRATTEQARWMAAVLACGPRALLSHRSAAALTGLRRTSQRWTEVTVPTQRRGGASIRPYRSDRLRPQDRAVIDAIPCTSVALTLLNLAAVLPRREIERACDEAEVRQLFDLAAIEELLDRSRGCRGAARLRAVLDEHAVGTTLTRSELEERALALCDSYAIARPEVNVRLVCRPGIAPQVDFLWRAQHVVLETDGARFHASRRQVERDRRTEAELVRAGYRVLRATWWQVQREPRSVALMIRAALRG
jgi:hypothetical protein